MNEFSAFLWIVSAGMSGAFIGMSRNYNNRTPWQKIIYILSGSVVAFWLSPFICKQFELLEPEDVGAVAFASGLFWSAMISRVRKVINSISLPLGPKNK